MMKTYQTSFENGEWSSSFPTEIDSENTLVIFFASPMFMNNSTPIKELESNYPKSKIVGCSTAGEIYKHQINDNSISVVIICLEKTTIRKVSYEIMESSVSYQAGESLGIKLYDKDLSYVLILSDGMNVNGSELVNGLRNALPNGTAVTGGLAGDGDRFCETWIYDSALKTNAIVAIGFYGKDFTVKFGCKGGWDVFGPERLITKSNDNILYEIDHKPALTLYKRYLGERASGLPSSALLFPLAIRPNNDTPLIVRTILSVNENAQSMIFAGNIPEGWKARLMRGNQTHLIDGATCAAYSATNDIDKETSGAVALAISCVGRRIVLGENTFEEVQAVAQGLPSNTFLMGFYSYGEISPFKQLKCALHNQTMTVTIFYEK